MNKNPENQKSENALREEAILQFWKDNALFAKTLEKESLEGDFVFFEGPPTANGRPGIHHVEARSFKDIIPRYKTMRGFRVQRKAGWDTHGLPVELQVEKQLGLKSKKDIEAYSVTEFNKKCRESVWEYKTEWEDLTNRMGYWLDMEHPYVTYDNSYIEALWGVMKKISDKPENLLYKDFRVGPWCPRCGTSLSSHELNQPGAYKDVKDLSIYAKFKIVGTDNGYFVAWTTTPWTLPGNVALAVGADIDYVEAKVGDEILVVAKDKLSVITESYEIVAEHKGSEMVGMKYESLYPFLSDLINGEQKEKLANAFQVYAADFVNTTDGTGIVHTAVMYGADDFELGTKVGLPKFHTVNEEGKFISGTGFLEGRYVKEIDENGKPTLAVDIVNDLTERGLLFKKENYTHSYPHCWRCDTPLIYYARTSWYFRMSALREKLLAANEQINWEPDHVKDGRFGEWLDGIKDWAISRDRYWGTPLPVWETADKSRHMVIGSIDELRNYTGDAITKIIFVRHGEAEHNVHRMSSSALDKHPLTELGHQQAERAAQSLKDEHVDVVLCSPILRARQTAEHYCNMTGAEAILDERLGEIKSGNWEEKTQEDPSVKASRDAYKGLPIDERYLVKRGETGESWEDLDIRVKGFLDDVIEKYAGKTILCFAHQGTNSVALKLLKGTSNTESTLHVFHEIKNGKVSPVYVDTKRKAEFDLHKPYIDHIDVVVDGEKMFRTPEVMDVWFDSGCMPYAQSHEIGKPVNFDPAPADYISEATDQTRGWFYTLHAVSNMLSDAPRAMYKNVICLGLILDANGQKMSKSKGNVMDPWAMFDKYGADVVRFWMYSVNQPGDAKNFDEKTLDEVKKKVFNLLENVVSFYEMYKTDEDLPDDQSNPYGNPDAHILDKWIIAKLDELTATVTAGLERYDVLEPARAIREFVGELSTWYIRRSRDRFKGSDDIDRKRALRTTRIVLQNLSLIMAPFAPFIAEEVFQKTNWMPDWESVHLGMWPNRGGNEPYDHGTVISDMEKLRMIVTLGLEARQKANIKVRQPLSKITIPESLADEYLEILKDELNVKEVIVDENIEKGTVRFDTEITDALRDEGDMRELVRRIQDMRKDGDLVPTDRVQVFLTDAEPVWFAKFKSELLQTVGASEIIWGSDKEGVEK